MASTPNATTNPAGSSQAPLLDAPLAARRARLVALLADAPNQLTLCPQTIEPELSTS